MAAEPVSPRVQAAQGSGEAASAAELAVGNGSGDSANEATRTPPTRPVIQTSSSELDSVITPENAKGVIERLLRHMAISGEAGQAARRATDLHINPGRPPDYRIERVIKSVKMRPLSQEEVELLCRSMMNEQQWARFERQHCFLQADT